MCQDTCGRISHGGSQDDEQGTRPGAIASNALEWRGRFPYNEIISLLDVNRPFNLAESTSQDLTFGELLDLPGLEGIRDLKLGYGTSAGSIELREEIAKACNVPVDQVVTTLGTTLGLFLLAFELCRPGDEAVARDTVLPTEPRLSRRRWCQRPRDQAVV